MIKLTKLNNEDVYINERYIELIDVTPDTTIKIHDGTVFVVKETPDEVRQLIIDWNRRNYG